MNDELRSEISRLIADLSAGRYAEIAADGRTGRLSAEELRTAVEQYGRTLLLLPDGAWDSVDECPQVDAPNTVAVDVPLWTKEEGRSDLTLSLTATKQADRWILQVDDLHVL
ncbi:hypothetical protein BE08_26980 [Sorangium cellulosum]|uniref:DUF7668 domain-containing protein n=1 Tax=Sorangium cellulosum TaxID=56 RepID=A0A150PU85_SORCE|nr:hypothetical protein BE08_26980 [Sorangium cellulosum]